MSLTTHVRSQNYLKWLPLIALVSCFATIFLSYSFQTRENTLESYSYIGVGFYVINLAAYWFTIGKVTQNFKIAGLAFLINIVIHALSLVSLYNGGGSYTNHQGYQLLFLLLSLLPNIFFALQVLPKNNLWQIIIFVLAISFIPQSIGHRENIIYSFINDLYNGRLGTFVIKVSSNTTIVFFAFAWFYNIILWVAKFLFIFSFIENAQKFDFGFRDKFLNLSNTYTKTQGAIVFIVSKIVIFCLPFYFLSGLVLFIKGDYYSTPTLMAILINFCVFMFNLVALYAFINFYRKFILEYFYSYNLTPSIGYWLYLIPVLGTIAFLVSISSCKKVDEKQRINTFLASPNNNNNNTIFIIIMVFQAIYLIMSLLNQNLFGFLPTIVTIVLLYFFKKEALIIYGFVFLIVLNTFILYFSYSGNYSEFILKLIYQTITLYILVGIFHIDTFEYLPDIDITDETVNNLE